MMRSMREILDPTSQSSNISQEESFKKEVSKIKEQVKSNNEEPGNLDETDGIDCPICKNKGYIYMIKENEIVPYLHECECITKRNSVKYAKKSGMNELLNYRIKDYQTNEKWQEQVKNLAIEYVREKRKEWICLLGQSGSGKTHICSAIAKTWIDRSKETKYATWNLLIREIKNDNLNDKTMMYAFMRVPVLYIDDLFKGKYTEVDITLAFDLLNYRYNNNLVTIITSELSFNDIMQIDAAIAGRIKERCGRYLFEIAKDDKRNYRLK